MTPIALTDGGFGNQENAVAVQLMQSVVLDSGDTLVALSCLAGASGGTQSTELLLFGPDASELDYTKLPLGEPTISADGTGSIEFDEYGPNDPRCCPTGKSRVSFNVTDGTIVVGELEVITPPES